VRVADDRNRFAQQLFEPLPRRYDRLAELLSFGQNARWRGAMVDAIEAAAPERVLDVATGTAGVAIQIVSRTSATVIGIDLTSEMLLQGRRNVGARGLSDRVGLLVGRGEQLPFPDASFDALTFTYLLRYVDDPGATLAELARVVKPGGAIASLEFLAPPSAFWRGWWWGYTRIVLPLAGGMTGGREWFRVGRFLGPSISGHYRRYPLPRLAQLWKDAGIAQVHQRVMSLGGGLVMWGTRSDV
jgi:demethylmenaquinone methyltransferase / 2-methoxy-6-polyprenyl-1,4-benzoquinol methylase